MRYLLDDPNNALYLYLVTSFRVKRSPPFRVEMHYSRVKEEHTLRDFSNRANYLSATQNGQH